MVRINILEQKNQSSGVANSSEKAIEKITKKLEDIIETFNREVFKEDKLLVFVEASPFPIKEYVYGTGRVRYEGIYSGSIDIEIDRPYLENVLNNYRENPELIKDLMERVFSKNIEAYMFIKSALDEYQFYKMDELRKKLKKEKIERDEYPSLKWYWFHVVYDGLQTIIKDLYKTIVSEYKIDTNESLEKILKKMGKYITKKFKDKEYLKNLEEKLRRESEEKIAEKVKKISEYYYKCKDIESSNALEKLLEKDLIGEIYNIIYYEFSPLILQKNPGILKILEDLSSKPRIKFIKKFPPKYVLIKIPVDQYKKIISDELGEKFKILEDTFSCTENLSKLLWRYYEEKGRNRESNK